MKNKNRKCPLHKRLLRDLKANLGRYLAISLMLIVFISILSGFLSVANGVKSTFDKNNETSKREDGQFTTSEPIETDKLKTLETMGIKVYENFYSEKKLNKNTTIRLYKSRKNIDIETYESGRKPTNSDEIALDRLFCNKNKIKVGDIVKLDNKSYKVTGLICMPDYSALFEKNSSLMMDAYHFGVGVVSDTTFEQDFATSEFSIINNYSYLFKDHNMSKKDEKLLSEKLLSKANEEGIVLTGFCSADMNQSLSFVEDDMGSDVPMMKVLCYIILVIMAFVFSVVICSTIEEEAPIIGTLLSNGYTRKELIRSYMALPFIVTVISALVGNIIGYTIMPKVFIGMYYRSYSILDAKIKIDPEALILTTVIPILLMTVINYFVLFKKLSITPLRFLRKDLKKGKNKSPLKLPNIAFIKRFRLRVIIQNLTSYFILFIGLLLACFLLLLGICITPVMKNYINAVDDTSFANYQYILNMPVDVTDEGKIEKIVTATFNTKYKFADKDYEVTVYGLNENSKYFDDIQDSLLKESNDGIYNVYVSDSLKNKIHVKNGEVFKIRDPYSDKTYKLRIQGVHKYAASLCVFMNKEQLNGILGKENSYFNGYLSDQKLTIDEKYVSLMVTPEDLTKVNKQVVTTFNSIAPMCIVLSVVMFLALMYILTKLIIDKNTMSISYMKVFGYNEKEISRLYLRTTTIVLMISLLIYVPIEYFGMKYIFDFALLKLNNYIPADIDAIYYLLIIAISLVSYLVINTIQVKRIQKIDMALALKNRE